MCSCGEFWSGSSFHRDHRDHRNPHHTTNLVSELYVTANPAHAGLAHQPSLTSTRLGAPSTPTSPIDHRGQPLAKTF